MNKNTIFIIIFLIILLAAGFYLYNFNKTSKSQKPNYTASKTNVNNITNNTSTENKPKHEIVETEIASYTSKIRTKYPERQNNITIACSTLNDTIVENETTFSFNETLGKATSSKGYEEANVFRNGIEVEALGGGKCQVSSTLYNAVLQIDTLKVIERHPHSGRVYYVPQGKDAAVSYGSQDFKFQNNTGNSIKIKATNTENDLTIKLLKLE